MPNLSGLYMGVEIEHGGVNNASQVQALDDYLMGSNGIIHKKEQDSVVAITMMPSLLITNSSSAAALSFPVNKPYAGSGVGTHTGYIGSHQVRNNKLWTYPYTFLCVDTLNDSHEYKYEWFSTAVCNFTITGCMTPNPEILCIPNNYNGSPISGIGNENPTESVTISGYPQCAFSIDAYRAWLAQKAAGDVISVGGAAAGAIGGAIAGGPVGAAVGGALGALGIGSKINGIVQETTKGAKTRGTIGSSAEVAARVKDIYFKEMGITEQYAAMIDSYFDRFGYACGRVKYPNRNVRPHWTYTKTQNCTIDGNVPADDLEKIKSIYNNGITFWRNGSEVGLYTLNNSPA